MALPRVKNFVKKIVDSGHRFLVLFMHGSGIQKWAGPDPQYYTPPDQNPPQSPMTQGRTPALPASRWVVPAWVKGLHRWYRRVGKGLGKGGEWKIGRGSWLRRRDFEEWTWELEQRNGGGNNGGDVSKRD